MAKATTSAAPVLTITFAVLLTTFYGFFAWQLYENFVLHNPSDPKLWDHAWSIFGGIQSAGLSAIGVLLGVAVQQPRVNDAKTQAAVATGQAQKARDAITQVLGANDLPNEKGGGVSIAGTTKLTDEARSMLVEGLQP